MNIYFHCASINYQFVRIAHNFYKWHWHRIETVGQLPEIVWLDFSMRRRKTNSIKLLTAGLAKQRMTTITNQRRRLKMKWTQILALKRMTNQYLTKKRKVPKRKGAWSPKPIRNQYLPRRWRSLKLEDHVVQGKNFHQISMVRLIFP
ncbi:hypothetical protein J437_LFUL016910 [Ladona fulva]|uniref:Uncharacterized protein n=1 Tax=Ladona fulva TaxID=123851 RepID=A0A8K0KLG2_LADFU|nr:hypothetical protein J437_LFUL016910 [Ladona fulva]